MNLYEVKLRINGPFMTPWQGDTLFGHIAWAFKETHGEKSLKEWLNSFNDEPPFIVSNGFIEGSFPRPIIPPPEKKAKSREEKIALIDKGKKLKKLRYIHEKDFLDFIRGYEISFSHELKSSFTPVVRTHSVISRMTGTSMQEDGLFEEESIYLEGHDKISFFVRSNNIKNFEELLKVVSYSGFGKKKSLGYGQFDIDSIHKRDDLDRMQKEANAVVVLSHGVPKTSDPTDGWYKLETKYGKLGGRVSDQGNIFKKPMTRYVPGSVFRIEEIKPYYGKMVHGLSQDNDSVVQYGYSLAIPIILPAYLI